MLDFKNLVLPEGKALADITESLDKFFSNIPTYQLKELYYVQTEKDSKKYFEQKIIENHQKKLQEDGPDYKQLCNLIYGSHLNMREHAKEDTALCAMSVKFFLQKQSFATLADMYQVASQKIEDEYPSLLVDTFADILIAKVSHNETLSSIEKACYHSSDVCYNGISKKIQEKLKIVFS